MEHNKCSNTNSNQINERRKIFTTYQKQLEEKVRWQSEGSNAISNRWITAVNLPSGTKVNDVQNSLAANGIETRPVWKPMHLQPVFKGFQSRTNGCAEKLFELGICLPSSDSLNDLQISEITNLISKGI